MKYLLSFIVFSCLFLPASMHAMTTPIRQDLKKIKRDMASVAKELEKLSTMRSDIQKQLDQLKELVSIKASIESLNKNLTQLSTKEKALVTQTQKQQQHINELQSNLADLKTSFERYKEQEQQKQIQAQAVPETTAAYNQELNEILGSDQP